MKRDTMTTWPVQKNTDGTAQNTLNTNTQRSFSTVFSNFRFLNIVS